MFNVQQKFMRQIQKQEKPTHSWDNLINSIIHILDAETIWQSLQNNWLINVSKTSGKGEWHERREGWFQQGNGKL